MEKSSQIRNNYSYTRGGARGKKRDLPTFELEIISVVFHERWRETRFRFIKKRLWRCPWPEIARRGVKISLTSDRVCWLGDFHFSGKHDPFFSLPPLLLCFLASNDLSNFKEDSEEGELFSTVIDNSNGTETGFEKMSAV